VGTTLVLTVTAVTWGASATTERAGGGSGVMRGTSGVAAGSWPAQPDEHGRGLLIVASLARAWGRSGDSERGWTVWFEMDAW
jgi:hypothetical protein